MDTSRDRVLARLHYSRQGSGECGHVWSGALDGLDRDDGEFFVLLDRPDLELVDLCFVGTIVEEWQTHVLAALECLRIEVMSRPGYFGLTCAAAHLQVGEPMLCEETLARPGNRRTSEETLEPALTMYEYCFYDRSDDVDIRIDKDIKAAAKMRAEDLGLSLSALVRQRGTGRHRRRLADLLGRDPPGPRPGHGRRPHWRLRRPGWCRRRRRVRPVRCVTCNQPHEPARSRRLEDVTPRPTRRQGSSSNNERVLFWISPR